MIRMIRQNLYIYIYIYTPIYTLVLMAITLNLTLQIVRKSKTLRFGKAPVLKKLDVSWVGQGMEMDQLIQDFFWTLHSCYGSHPGCLFFFGSRNFLQFLSNGFRTVVRFWWIFFHAFRMWNFHAFLDSVAVSDLSCCVCSKARISLRS